MVKKVIILYISNQHEVMRIGVVIAWEFKFGISAVFTQYICLYSPEILWFGVFCKEFFKRTALDK